MGNTYLFWAVVILCKAIIKSRGLGGGGGGRWGGGGACFVKLSLALVWNCSRVKEQNQG